MRKSIVIGIMCFCVIMMIGITPVYSNVWARVSGTVLTKDGKPIEGAQIILKYAEEKLSHTLKTDKKGRWRKVDLRPGQWNIDITADGYLPRRIGTVFSALNKNKPIEIILLPVPKDPMAEGDSLFRQGDYEKALKEYQGILSTNMNHIKIHEKIGLCYYKLNDLDNAVKAFERVLEKKPDAQNTLINLSAIHFEKGNLKEGMKYFEQLDEEDIKDHTIFFNIGIILFNKNHMELAIQYFKKCLIKNPNYIEGYFQLALTYLNQGKLEEAKNNLNKVIQLKPGSDKAFKANEMLKLLN